MKQVHNYKKLILYALQEMVDEASEQVTKANSVCFAGDGG